MSTIDNNTQFLSFDAWLAANQELADREFKGGTEWECDACDGTGYVQLRDQSDYRFRDHMLDLYEEQKRADARKLEEWNKIVQGEAP